LYADATGEPSFDDAESAGLAGQGKSQPELVGNCTCIPDEESGSALRYVLNVAGTRVNARAKVDPAGIGERFSLVLAVSDRQGAHLSEGCDITTALTAGQGRGIVGDSQNQRSARLIERTLPVRKSQ